MEKSNQVGIIKIVIENMRKTTSFIVSVSLLWQLAPLAALAAFHDALKQKREEAKQEIQEKRETLKQEVQQKRDALKQELGQRKEALKMELEKRKEEFRKKREALEQEVKQKREMFKTEAQARRDELKKKLGEKRGENIEKFFNKMVDKFGAATERLKGLADKIEDRIKKAEGRGRDMTDPRNKLITARERIVEAEKALEDAKAKYAEAVKDPDFRASFQKVREIVAVLSQKAKDAHQALVDVITSMKGIGKGEKPEETPASTPVPAQ